MQSPHVSSLNSTYVLLARTTCAANDVACAVSECLGSLLDPRSPGRQKLYVTDAAACAVSERLGPLLDPDLLAGTNCMPPMLQFVQSPSASDLYSTRVLLAATTCTADAAACTVSERPGLYLTQVILAGTNCAADAVVCAVSERVESSLDLCSRSRHKLMF